jgi:hypothetical protein
MQSKDKSIVASMGPLHIPQATLALPFIGSGSWVREKLPGQPTDFKPISLESNLPGHRLK